ncbi:type VII secretion system-associated protein [Nocardia sp. CA-290969]|uniref:type VII secretion system-associated protein n=1 Tax=Nocardia sp. CA-290969 TaxID=3239986 RepID=UPI003D8D3232
MAEPPPEAIRQGDWFLLLDPAYRPEPADSALPVAGIVGGWMVTAEGVVGPFEPNPEYIPADESSPTDPVDSILRRIASGEQLAEDLIESLRNAVVEIGCDEEGRPLIGTAPDGAYCVVIATAGAQKRAVEVDRWWPVLGDELADIVPPDTDLLLNPGGVAPFRLTAGALRRTG